MKENKYDDKKFFDKYSRFPRSIEGLNAAGEWHQMQRLLPSFRGKRVLDLGCGFGWHCVYAAEQRADSVIGIDLSVKMIAEAKNKTHYSNVTYVCSSIEDYEYPQNAFDIVISSLAFHYVESFDRICDSVKKCLVHGGDFVFSVEHPVFTAQGKQDWIYDEAGNALYWPVDNYYFEGLRNTIFLGENVTKYHKTTTTYLKSLIQYGFRITAFCEPKPTDEMLNQIPTMKDDLRRPMMLIISAKKE